MSSRRKKTRKRRRAPAAQGQGGDKDDIRQMREHRQLNNYMGSINDATDLDLDKIANFRKDRGWAYYDPHDIMALGEANEFRQQKPKDEAALARYGTEVMLKIEATRPMGRKTWTVSGAGRGTAAAAGDKPRLTPAFDPRAAIPAVLAAVHRRALDAILDGQRVVHCEWLSFVRPDVAPEDEMPIPCLDDADDAARCFEFVADVVEEVHENAKMHRIRFASDSTAVHHLPPTERVLVFHDDVQVRDSHFRLVLWLRQVSVPCGTTMPIRQRTLLAEDDYSQRALKHLVPIGNGVSAADAAPPTVHVMESDSEYWYVARRHYVPVSWTVLVDPPGTA